jgi:hypothetical protein
MDTAPTSRPDGSCWYTIRLQGRLEPRWAALFGGMTLTTSDGFTELTGAVVDQSALHGLLQQLRDLGLPLHSVVRTVPTDKTPTPPHSDTATAGD